MAKVSTLSRHIELSLERHLSPRQRSQKLASYALDKITEAKAINGRNGQPASHRQIVDGREGAPLASVKPDGVIIARFDLVTEVLEWIGRALVEASPVLTGLYQRSHVLFVDDVERDPSAEPIADFREAVFLNTQPYARKIEGAFGPELSPQAPDGVYHVVAGIASKRFGNVARVLYGYRSFSGAKNSGADRQPAIIVRPF